MVVLKGPALAADAYADASAREPGDIDLLAGARDVPIIVRALRPLGLEPRGEPGLGHLTLAKEWLEVEVHWQLFENARLMPVDPSWLRSPRQVETLGLVVPALPPRAHWLSAMVHGLRHGWFRLKWLADVAALAQRHPELTEIEALEAVAPAYRTALATGLLFAEAALGPFLAPRSRAWAPAVPGTRLQLRRSWSPLSSDVPESMPLREAIGEALGRLAMSTDARYRLEELRLLLLTAAELRWLRRGIPRMTPARVGYRDLDD